LKGKKILTTSEIIAKNTDNEHESIIRLILKYEDRIKKFGILTFEYKKTNKQGRPAKFYYLNDEQVKFLIMIMNNDENILNLKESIILNTFDIHKFKAKTIKKHIYIIKNENNLYKIGVAKNVNKRINAIKTQSAHKIQVIFISKQIYNALKIESVIHKKYKLKRIIGEWFELNEDDVNDIIKIYLPKYKG
jgi:phage regulator Rha-like protein